MASLQASHVLCRAVMKALRRLTLLHCPRLQSRLHHALRLVMHLVELREQRPRSPETPRTTGPACSMYSYERWQQASGKCDTKYVATDENTISQSIAVLHEALDDDLLGRVASLWELT